MASKKTLAQRLFNIARGSSQAIADSRISGLTRMRRSKPRIAPDPRDSGTCRRFLHKRAVFVTPDMVPAVSGAGGSLIERLKELGLPKDRIRLDEMFPPAEQSPAVSPTVTVEDARKLMRAAEMEMVKSKLREMEKNWVPYPEFARVCGEACSDPERATWVANMLEKSGNVIVLGNSVCLRPEQITKAVASLLPTRRSADNEAFRHELRKLETLKSEIDKKADELVRRELWAGLGFLMAQTIGFFRLTFWELSWDVMEPICFYLTSTYFMAGYAFFLRTSKEPSFEGFYRSRFETKQKRLMEARNFDIDRYNELRKTLCPTLSRSGSRSDTY